MRLIVEVFVAVFSVVVCYYLFSSDALINANPFYLLLVTMTKVSIAILHWHIFRKQYFNKVNWDTKLKDFTNAEIITVGSFFLFIAVYTGSYS